MEGLFCPEKDKAPVLFLSHLETRLFLYFLLNGTQKIV